MTPLINILIRTGKRPELFKRCLRSIAKQTYRNIRIIISTDGYKVPSLETIEVKPDTTYPYYWNLYCNHLKDKVIDGWLIYLDDDDVLENRNSIAGIVPYLNKEADAVICQFKRWKNRKPTNEQIAKGEIKKGHIGMPCIILHHSKKHVADFDGYQAADYRFIKDVTQKVRTKFIPHVVVETDRISNGK